MTTVCIPYKFPSLNDYIRECRTNKYSGNKLKKKVQKDIKPYIMQLPKFEKSVIVNFIWVEGNKRRDVDNVAFAKKFVLDAMVECGKLPNDNVRFVKGFTDTIKYGDEFKLFLSVEEVNL